MSPDEEKMSLAGKEKHISYGSIYKDSNHNRDVISSRRNDNIINPSPNEEEVTISNVDFINPSPVIRSTLARFWILWVFSLLSWFHSVLFNTWGPISESVEYAFPSWTSATVSMTVNWVTIMFILGMFPMCFLIQRCGLRNVMILSSAILFVGTGVRCITMTMPYFTILCDFCAILVGVASTIILSGPSLIASEWFPINERTTAVAVMMGASQFGGIGSYLEPLLVRQPGPGVTVEEIKYDIKILMYICAGFAGVLLLAVLIYFPSRPSIPPSVTSSTERLDIKTGMVSLAKNKDFLLILLSYGVSLGPPIAWLTLLDYSLLPLGFHQNDAMWIGLSSVLASSLFPVAYGRFMDHFRGHMRSSLVVLMITSGICFYWFLLISYGTIPVSIWQVYVSIVCSLTFNYTTIPLFFELAVEMAYPVPEILVSGVLTAADNLFSTLYLTVFLFPNAGYLWQTSTLVLCSSFTILPLMAAKITYTRTKADSCDT